MGQYPFAGCDKAQIYTSVEMGHMRWSDCMSGLYLYFYAPKTLDGEYFVNSPFKDHRLIDYRLIEDHQRINQFFNHNFFENFIQLNQWKDDGKIKFIPPDFTMEIFPAQEMANYFVNNNHKRWAQLVETSHFNELLYGQQKRNSLTDLAVHRGYTGYSDAHQQYLIRTYDQTLSQLKTQMTDNTKQMVEAAQK